MRLRCLLRESHHAMICEIKFRLFAKSIEGSPDAAHRVLKALCDDVS